MVSASSGFRLRGEFMLCHHSFLFYRRQWVICQRPNLRVHGCHRMCLSDLSLQKAWLTHVPTCYAMKFISTFMEGHAFYMPLQANGWEQQGYYKSVVCKQVCFQEIELLWWATFESGRPQKPYWTFFTTALSDTSTQFSFTSSLRVITVCSDGALSLPGSLHVFSY